MSDNFTTLLVAAGLPEPVREYRFAPPRRWRLDYCWVEAKIALEIEGAVWVHGRHTRGSGFVKDIEKYNELTIRGFRLLRATPQQVDDGTALAWLLRMFEAVL